MTRVFRKTFGIATIVAVTTTFNSSASAAVNFDWATIGNAGNTADTTGFGSVANEYRISKHEVTNAQYNEFLNAVAASDPNSLYSANMGTDPRGGITQSGSSGSFTYAFKVNMANKPVNWVSFIDAMRFTNWLHNGQTAGGTESGVYNISNGLSETRAANASYFIPSENEWYKSAYHQPAVQGGDSDDYWQYPTASNSVPTVATANSVGDINNPGTNVANYLTGADWNGQDGNVTTVGSAGPNSASFYGTFDQGGNVWEWHETPLLGGRGYRGGSWAESAVFLDPIASASGGPTIESPLIGFRIASVIPEPASVALVAMGTPLLLRRLRG